MTPISTRAEAGDDAAVLLRALWKVAHPEPIKATVEWREWNRRGTIFDQFIDINTPEAHLAAAMMLVPEGCQMELWSWPSGSAEASLHFDTGRTVERTGRTPAHALIAAIARIGEADER